MCSHAQVIGWKCSTLRSDSSAKRAGWGAQPRGHGRRAHHHSSPPVRHQPCWLPPSFQRSRRFGFRFIELAAPKFCAGHAVLCSRMRMRQAHSPPPADSWWQTAPPSVIAHGNCHACVPWNCLNDIGIQSGQLRRERLQREGCDRRRTTSQSDAPRSQLRIEMEANGDVLDLVSGSVKNRRMRHDPLPASVSFGLVLRVLFMEEQLSQMIDDGRDNSGTEPVLVISLSVGLVFCSLL